MCRIIKRSSRLYLIGELTNVISSEVGHVPLTRSIALKWKEYGRCRVETPRSTLTTVTDERKESEDIRRKGEGGRIEGRIWEMGGMERQNRRRNEEMNHGRISEKRKEKEEDGSMWLLFRLMGKREEGRGDDDMFRYWFNQIKDEGNCRIQHTQRE